LQSGLLLAVHADMGECGSKARRGLMLSAGTRVSLRPSFSSTRRQNLLDPHGVEHVLERALVRSVRSPWSMKTRTIASATSVAPRA
jgi:hypothetical protein